MKNESVGEIFSLSDYIRLGSLSTKRAKALFRSHNSDAADQSCKTARLAYATAALLAISISVASEERT